MVWVWLWFGCYYVNLQCRYNSGHRWEGMGTKRGISASTPPWDGTLWGRTLAHWGVKIILWWDTPHTVGVEILFGPSCQSGWQPWGGGGVCGLHNSTDTWWHLNSKNISPVTRPMFTSTNDSKGVAGRCNLQCRLIWSMYCFLIWNCTIAKSANIRYWVCTQHL